MSASSLGTTGKVTQPPPLDSFCSCSCGKSQNHLQGIEEEDAKLSVSRLEKWRLQAVSREILPKERVARCKRRILKGGSFVGVYQASNRSTYYGNLETCSSVWVCPVCASKIAEGRRAELRWAMDAWAAKGGQVVQLVLTLPHGMYQSCEEVLKAFAEARRVLMNRKTWKTLIKALGMVGSIRALEVTYGENGWHIHSHELLFIQGGEIDLDQIELRILGMWVQALVSSGWKAPNGHGVKVQGGDQAGDYVAKWGMDHELTKGHIKKGREGNESPWDFLRRVSEGDSRAAGLFQEYARAFKGRSQLRWSKGLRDLLGITDQTDEALAESQQDEESVLLGNLTMDHWRLVVAADRRGELLEVARASGWPGVLEYVRELAIDSRIERKLRSATTRGKR